MSVVDCAFGLRLRRGGRVGAGPIVADRPAERSAELAEDSDLDDVEPMLRPLDGLWLRTRRLGELLLRTSNTRVFSSFSSAFFKLCAMRVACNDCCISELGAVVETLRSVGGWYGGGGATPCIDA